MESPVGVEPTNGCFADSSPADEGQRHWLRVWDSNPRLPGYEPGFLPLDEPAMIKVREELKGN